MIKPAFWDDEKLSQLSRDARLVFIGMWNFSDDYGVVKGNALWLKNQIFPYDENLSKAEFEQWLNELCSDVTRSLIPFTESGEQYYYIRRFTFHQKINKPSGLRNPEAPDDILDHSYTPTPPLQESSSTGNPPVTSQLEEEREREEEQKSTAKADPNRKNIIHKNIIYKLPTKDEIDNSSSSKLKSEIDLVCDQLYEKKIFPKVHTWKNKMLKEKKNERAILHTLTRCFLKRVFKGTTPWGYCKKIIEAEHGNYSEQDYHKTSP